MLNRDWKAHVDLMGLELERRRIAADVYNTILAIQDWSSTVPEEIPMICASQAIRHAEALLSALEHTSLIGEKDEV